MKLVIALALIAAVAAHPGSIVLPTAEEPAFESQDIQPVSLPKAELPAVEEESVPAFESVDISPALIPQDVIEALNQAEISEIAAEPVNFVDNVEPVADQEIVSEPVKFVDNVPAEPIEYVYVPQAEEPAVDSQDFQDAQPIVLPSAAIPAFEDGSFFELIDISPVFIHQEVIEELKRAGFVKDISAGPVYVVDDPVENSGDSIVSVVDVADNSPAVDQPEALDTVRIVELPNMAPIEQIAPGELEAIRVAVPEFQDEGLAVNFVDAPRFPGKIFDDPLLR